YPTLIRQERALLQHDNAPAHRANLTKEKLDELDGTHADTKTAKRCFDALNGKIDKNAAIKPVYWTNSRNKPVETWC
ncbi:unnamed protein product, partial [Rotaria magnacalcarata]